MYVCLPFSYPFIFPPFSSTMFGTVLSYVSLRLLGESADVPYMIAARDFIKKYGGALYSPSWCKVCLLLFLYFDYLLP